MSSCIGCNKTALPDDVWCKSCQAAIDRTIKEDEVSSIPEINTNLENKMSGQVQFSVPVQEESWRLEAISLAIKVHGNAPTKLIYETADLVLAYIKGEN